MKKLLLVLLVITLAVSLLIGCNPVIPDEGEGEGGGKIAFESDRDGGSGEIYVMNADGSNQTRLTNDEGSSACFSSDGTMIAFSSVRDGDFEIYVMNADGSNQIRLTNNPAWNAEPCFSPDGTMIAFTSYYQGMVEIFVMNADGSNQTRLTNNPAMDMAPSWGP
jgi:TolB protein